MSRSIPKIENPCKKFISFSGDTGLFTFWDKELGDKGEKVEIPFPIYFTVMDELNTISGFSEKAGSGLFSNEVHYLGKEILNVRSFKGGLQVVGLYKDIRDNIVAMGGKFTKSVYALLINPDKSLEFVNFQFKGSSFSSWVDFTKRFDPMKVIVGVNETVTEKKGKTTYEVPVFKTYKLTPEIDAEAIKYDEILQEYLKEYFAQSQEKTVITAEAANPLTDEIPEHNPQNKEGVWQGKLPKTKEELIAIAKAAMETKGGGKHEVKSMSRIQDLPGTDDENFPPENDDLSGLPF